MSEDLETRMRYCEVVCKTALKMARPGFRTHNKERKGDSVMAISQREFGLTEHQVSQCLGRARTFLAQAKGRVVV